MPGSFGRVKWGSHFTGIYDSVAWGATNLVAGDGLGGVGFASVNEGSFASTIDEDGGILAITTDTADNDNAVLIGGRCKPSSGTAWIEARFKYSNVDCAVFVGFSETMALDTPVMPAEFATATMTYNGTGNMIGLQYDVDGTTDDWRAVAANGGANTGGTASANGIRANATVTADNFVIARVVVNSDGGGECWLEDVGHAGQMRLIARYDSGALTPGDLLYPVLMIENRSGAARVLEVDYMFGESGVDWTA